MSHHTLCPFLFLAYSCVLISLFLALYLPVVLSLSFSLPQSKTLLGAAVALSLFLSHCFHSPISFSRSLSHSLTGPLTLFSRVISDSICTDSELGLMFVVTLWYNMRFLQGSVSFSLAFFQAESHCWLVVCVTLSLQLLVVSSIVYW